MNVCLDCGRDYNYDSSNPLGASSLRCPSCRKKQSAENKKIILFNIAGHGNIQCRKCGYSRSHAAIVMTDTVSYLSKATTHEEKEHRAKTQYLLCLNCSAEIKAGEVEAKVINSKSYPVVVEFYEREITVVKKKIEARVNYSNNAIEAEITRDEPKGARVVGTPKRIDCGTETDMP